MWGADAPGLITQELWRARPLVCNQPTAHVGTAWPLVHAAFSRCEAWRWARNKAAVVVWGRDCEPARGSLEANTMVWPPSIYMFSSFYGSDSLLSLQQGRTHLQATPRIEPWSTMHAPQVAPLRRFLRLEASHCIRLGAGPSSQNVAQGIPAFLTSPPSASPPASLVRQARPVYIIREVDAKA